MNFVDLPQLADDGSVLSENGHPLESKMGFRVPTSGWSSALYDTLIRVTAREVIELGGEIPEQVANYINTTSPMGYVPEDNDSAVAYSGSPVGLCISIPYIVDWEQVIWVGSGEVPGNDYTRELLDNDIIAPGQYQDILPVPPPPPQPSLDHSPHDFICTKIDVGEALPELCRQHSIVTDVGAAAADDLVLPQLHRQHSIVTGVGAAAADDLVLPQLHRQHSIVTGVGAAQPTFVVPPLIRTPSITQHLPDVFEPDSIETTEELFGELRAQYFDGQVQSGWDYYLVQRHDESFYIATVHWNVIVQEEYIEFP